MIFHLSGMDFPSLSSVRLLTPSFSPHLFQAFTPHSSIPPSHPLLISYSTSKCSCPAAWRRDRRTWCGLRMGARGIRDRHWQSMLCCAWDEAAQRAAATWSSSIPFSCGTGKTLQSVYQVSERYDFSQVSSLCMIFHKFITWSDLGKLTQYKAQSLYDYGLYTIFWRSQNFSKAQFSTFIFC